MISLLIFTLARSSVPNKTKQTPFLKFMIGAAVLLVFAVVSLIISLVTVSVLGIIIGALIVGFYVCALFAPRPSRALCFVCCNQNLP